MANQVLLDKLHLTASYVNANAGDSVNHVYMDKIHVTAAYRGVAGATNSVLVDKVHVTAAYRYVAPAARRRRSLNILF